MTRKKSLQLTVVVYFITLLLGFLSYYFLKDNMNLFVTTLIANIIMTTIIFIASLIINNSSLYDPYWSVIPMFIVFLWMVEFQLYTWEYILIFIAVIVWSLRLTINWVIGFKGFQFEDFRYVDFRHKFHKLYWVISYLGIHLFPTLMVYVAMYPIYNVFTSYIVRPSIIIGGSIVMMLGALISYVADTQLREHKKAHTGLSIRSGLWKYSRHPNYFGEVTFWAGAFIVGLSVKTTILSPVGIIAMLLLFNFYSVPKMEHKLLNNKPDYKSIVEEVPRFMFRKV